MMINYDYEALQRLYGNEVDVAEALQMWITGHDTQNGKISLNLVEHSDIKNESLYLHHDLDNDVIPYSSTCRSYVMYLPNN